MTTEVIRTKLEKIIDPYIPEGEKPDDVTDELDLMEDLHINSAHLVDIILDIEDAFDIEITDDEAEKMMSVGSAMEIIAEKSWLPMTFFPKSLWIGNGSVACVSQIKS